MGMKRESTFEAVRIVAMYMIVVSHYCGHGVLVWTETEGLTKYVLVCGVLGNVGSDIFLILSGYFLSRKEIIHVQEKLFKLHAKVWFYSISVYIVLCFTFIKLRMVIDYGSLGD